MYRSSILRALIAALLASGGTASGLAAGSAAASAASSPASAPHVRSVSDIVARLATSESLQRAAHDRLPLEQKWNELSLRIANTEAAFAQVQPSRQGDQRVSSLIGLSHEVWRLGNEAEALVHESTTLAQRLERELDALDGDLEQWRDNLPVLRQRQVPAQVIEGAESMAQQVQATATRVRDARDRALVVLVRAQALETAVEAAMSQVAAATEQVLARRAELDVRPVWHLDFREDLPGGAAAAAPGGRAQLGDYLSREWMSLSLLFGVSFGVCWWLFRRPSAAGASPAQRAYGRPVAASLLVALAILWWLAPDPPLRLYSAMLIAMSVPVAVLARRSFAAAVPLTLYGAVVATMLMGLRDLGFGGPLFERLLTLGQLACVAGALALDLRKGRLYQAFSRWAPETVRAAALIVIGIALLSALHAVFGLAGPTRTLRLAVGGLLGFGLVFGTAALALYGALLALYATPLLGWLRSARSADPALLVATRVVLTVLATAATVTTTVGAMTLMPEALALIEAISVSNVDVGAISLSTAAVLSALAIVGGTVLLSAALRFVLDREVFPRLQLRPGLGYAVATLTQWVLYIVGGVLALAVLGVDSTRITVLAGALGVGIGFGLQSVVNNFVSGLILIVERPVAVGDLVEIGPLLGEIQRIGIRSSSVRTTHGAEVIVPNGDFASKEVVNWTRSDRQRRYDIDVGVAYGSDPAQVLRLLEEAARAVPEVMSHPPPLAMFKDFGDSSLDFRLMAWVGTIDLGLQAQNALRVAVLAKLDAAGIAIPFPQREVYLHAASQHGA